MMAMIATVVMACSSGPAAPAAPAPEPGAVPATGARVIEHRDSTFLDEGRVGVWTKADSVTWFDELTVTPR